MMDMAAGIKQDAAATGSPSKCLVNRSVILEEGQERKKAARQRWQRTTKVLRWMHNTGLAHELVLMIFTHVANILLASVSLTRTFTLKRAVSYLLGRSRLAQDYIPLMEEAVVKATRFHFCFYSRHSLDTSIWMKRMGLGNCDSVRHLDLDFSQFNHYNYYRVWQMWKVAQLFRRLRTVTIRVRFDSLLPSSLSLSKPCAAKFGKYCTMAIEAVEKVLQDLRSVKIADTVAVKCANQRGLWRGPDAFMLLGLDHDREQYAKKVANALDYWMYGV